MCVLPHGADDPFHAPCAMDGVLASVFALPVRRGLIDYLLQRTLEAAAVRAVEEDCGGEKADVKLLHDHEGLLTQAGEILNEGRRASKEDARHALLAAGRCDIAKRLEVRVRGRRAAAHPEPGLNKQMLQAIRGLQAPPPKVEHGSAAVQFYVGDGGRELPVGRGLVRQA